MIATVLPTAIVSALVFGGLCLMSDRPGGALIAQIGTAIAAVIVLGSLNLTEPVWGMTPLAITGFGIGLFAAALAGMFYHLYLGRFTSVWNARGLFSGIYLLFSAVLGIVLLPLI